MESSFPWAAALITVAVGALSGGLTNVIAVWMLFHPYEERGRGPARIQGAIPKNKPRLAKAIGKVVGEKLLTSSDLVERLRAPEVRAAFGEALDRLLDDMLESEHGPLGERLDPPARQAVDRALGDLGERLSTSLAEYVGTEEFTKVTDSWANRLEGDDGQSVERWLAGVANSPEVAEGISSIVHIQLTRMADDETPLGERIPAGLVPVVEQGISDAIPGAVEQLGGLLADGTLRDSIAGVLRDTFDKAMRQMMIHERLLAKIVVNDKTMERLLSGLEKTGVDRLAEAIQAPAVKERMKGAINKGIHSILEQPMSNRIKSLGEQRSQQLEETVSGWLLGALQSETLRGSLLSGTTGALRARAPELLHRALKSDTGRAAVVAAVSSSGARLLDKPIGKPSSWLGEEATQQLRRTAHTKAWTWVEDQVPKVVARLSIQEMVEEKVQGFSTQRMEEIVRKVTQKELDLIVKWGYVLGAIVGAIAFSLSQVVGR